jgi:type II secretory pathway pseudopilin PulG
MTKPVHKKRSGMTLVDVLITVTIIAVLVAFIIPAYNLAIRSRENAEVASRLRQAAAAFSLYRSEMGSVPSTTSGGTIPPEMVDYFDAMNIKSWWTNVTPVGGAWVWCSTNPPSVMIIGATAATEQMQDIDKIFDGIVNLSAGNFGRNRTGYYYSLGQ